MIRRRNDIPKNSFPPYKEIQRFLIWCCRSLFGESQHRVVIGYRLSAQHRYWSIRTAHWNKYQNGCASDDVTADALKHKNNKTSTFFLSFFFANSQLADPHHTTNHVFPQFLWQNVLINLNSVTVRRTVKIFKLRHKRLIPVPEC